MKGKNIKFITGLICACIVLCLIAGFLYAGREMTAVNGVYEPAFAETALRSQITPSVALNIDRKVCALPDSDDMRRYLEVSYETERNLQYGRILKLDTEKLGGKQLRFAVLKDGRLKALDSFGVLNWTICEGDVFTCNGENFTAAATGL